VNIIQQVKRSAEHKPYVRFTAVVIFEAIAIRLVVDPKDRVSILPSVLRFLRSSARAGREMEYTSASAKLRLASFFTDI